MGQPVRSKKKPVSPSRTYLTPTGHIQRKMVRIDHDRSRFPARPTRACGGGGGSWPRPPPGSRGLPLGPAMARIAAAQGRPSLMLLAKAGIIALRPGEANTSIWSLSGPTPGRDFSFERGDGVENKLGK